MQYFKNFPKIKYNNNLIIHAPIRFAFQKLVVERDYDMWDYNLEDNESAEYVAQKYYGDGQLDWLIYLANRIINPYYAWPLDNLELIAYIEKKYGSLENALGTYTDYRDSEDVAINEIQYNVLAGHTRKNGYEYENYLNNEKRKIKLIDATQANRFKQTLEDYLVRENNQLSYYLQYNPQFSFSI